MSTLSLRCLGIFCDHFPFVYIFIYRLQRTLFNLTQSLMVDDPIDILKQTFAITLKSRQPNDLGNISSLSLDPTFPAASFSFPSDLSSSVGTEDRVTSFAAFADDALFLPRDPGLRFVSTSVLDFTISDVGEVSNLPSPLNLSFARSDVSVRVCCIYRVRPGLHCNGRVYIATFAGDGCKCYSSAVRILGF